MFAVTESSAGAVVCETGVAAVSGVCVVARVEEGRAKAGAAVADGAARGPKWEGVAGGSNWEVAA